MRTGFAEYGDFTETDLRKMTKSTIQRDKKRGYDVEQCTVNGKDQSAKIVKQPYKKHYPWIYVKLEDHSFWFSLRPATRTPNIPGQRSMQTLPHSMLSRGNPVIGAGECETDSTGKVVYVNNFSGHYKPTEKNLKATKENMERQGLSDQTAKWEVVDKNGHPLKEL